MKNKIVLAVCLLFAFRTVAVAQAQALPPATPASAAPPQAAITNGLIHLLIYLPDPEKGYYRGTRCAWSGVIPRLEYQGHSFCGQWFPQYAPTIHDAVMGPVESFAPLGYSDAAPGGGFVQIGVGALVRPDASPYSFSKYYPIRHPGRWQVKRSSAAIRFRQQLDDTAYSYVYTKRIGLPKGKPELVLSHTLINTGKKLIETDVYDHNFFLIDSQSTGPGFVLKFPFPLTSEEGRGLGELTAIQGDSIVILRQLTGKESVYAILHGFSDQASDYDIRLENHITGTGLRIRADRPLSRLAYWAAPRAFCPEPFIHVRVQPGKTFTWTIRYEFYTLSALNGR